MAVLPYECFSNVASNNVNAQSSFHIDRTYVSSHSPVGPFATKPHSSHMFELLDLNFPFPDLPLFWILVLKVEFHSSRYL